MMFKLPRTENGEVDLVEACEAHYGSDGARNYALYELVCAIDANARAEERERCEKEWEYLTPSERLDLQRHYNEYRSAACRAVKMGDKL